MLWVEERLKEDTQNFLWSKMPEYANHQWDGDKDPLAASWNCLGDAYAAVADGQMPKNRYVALESATGTGKTYAMARIVFWFLDCFPNSLVVTTAPTEAQLKLGLWSEISTLYGKIKKARPKAKKWVYRLAMDYTAEENISEEEKATQFQESWHAVSFIAGVKADETSANKARGFHRKYMLILLEECTGIPLPILTAFQNTCTGQTNFIFAVGNPDNRFDTLHRFITQPDVKGFRVSAFDHPNIVTQTELLAGAVTQSSVNSRTENYGKDSPLWSAMVRGISPAQSSDSLIKIEWIEQCVDLILEEDNSYNAVGIDVANSEIGDKAALVWGKGNTLTTIEEFQCPNATHLAYNIIYSDLELVQREYTKMPTSKLVDSGVNYDCIGVDAVGVGVATVNAFKDLHMDVQALQGGQWVEAIPVDQVTGNLLYTFVSLRAQMYWELREDLRLSKISIQILDKAYLNQLTRELCIPKFDTNSRHIAIERKESIKKRLGGKSPNIADAAAYWNFVRKRYRSRGMELPVFGG